MKKTKTQHFIEKLKRFAKINLFVQQFRLKTFRWWYWVDLSANVVERLRPVFDTFMMGLIINEVQLFASHKIDSLTKLYWYAGVTIGVRLLSVLYTSIYNRFDWYFTQFGMEAAIHRAFMEKLVYLNWEHIENPVMEKQ